MVINHQALKGRLELKYFSFNVDLHVLQASAG